MEISYSFYFKEILKNTFIYYRPKKQLNYYLNKILKKDTKTK